MVVYAQAFTRSSLGPCRRAVKLNKRNVCVRALDVDARRPAPIDQQKLIVKVINSTTFIVTKKTLEKLDCDHKNMNRTTGFTLCCKIRTKTPIVT